MDRAGVDPHEELGLKADATLAQVKKAYRRLAAQWYPDRNADPQAVRRMQRINEAYRLLCERVDAETITSLVDWRAQNGVARLAIYSPRPSTLAEQLAALGTLGDGAATALAQARSESDAGMRAIRAEAACGDRRSVAVS